MSDATELDTVFNKRLAAARGTIGSDVFDNASPDQTLRARIAGPGEQTLLSPGETLRRGPAPTLISASQSANTPPIGDDFACASEYTFYERLGRGGMGEVYRAMQNALCREVAIKKILPEHLTHAAAERIEAAFVSEALIIGLLDHPNIAPVHALGRDKDGNWFFSMKMVRGIEWRRLLHPAGVENAEKQNDIQARNLSVDDAVARAAHLDENLRILTGVCNAVAFAHSKGIIHRDLKPENVMIGAFGEVLTMDWGLALDVSEKPLTASRAERRLPTRSSSGFGGTPSYMAPEQFALNAAGQPTGEHLGPWTDVFLLGAILYELLSGRAPYSGRSVTEALRGVADCSPPELPSTAPPELAAICRKALAKTPGERFASALEFQRAVQEFLTHREAAAIASKAETEAQTSEIPSLARAVVLYDQALELWPANAAMASAVSRARARLYEKESSARWVHRSLAGAVAAIVLGLTIGFVWIRSERDRADTQEKAAFTSMKLAEASEREALRQMKIVETTSRELKVALSDSNRRGELLAETLDNQIFGVADELKKHPRMQDVRREVLTHSLEGYRRFLELIPKTPAAERSIASAHLRCGDLYADLGDTATSSVEYHTALDAFEKIAAEQNSAEAQRDLSIVCEKLGTVAEKTYDSAGAMAMYQRALSIREKIFDPKNDESVRDLEVAYNNIGGIRVQLGDTSGAIEAYKKALTIAEQRAAAQPTNAVAQTDLAASYSKFGDVVAAQKGPAEAFAMYRKAIAIFQKLTDAVPDDNRIARELAISYAKSGGASLRSGDVAASRDAYQQSLKILTRITAADPKNAPLQRDLAMAYGHLGDVSQNLGDLADALAKYRKSLELTLQLSSFDDKNAELKRDVGVMHNAIGDTLLLKGEAAPAAEAYKKALDIDDALATADPKSIPAQRDLSVTHNNLGRAILKQGDPARALESFKTSRDIRKKLADWDPRNTEASRDLANANNNCGVISMQIGDPKNALAFFKDALAAMERAVAEHPANTPLSYELSDYHDRVGWAYQALGDAERASESLGKWAGLREKLIAAAPDRVEAQQALGLRMINVGLSFKESKHFSLAIDWFTRTLALIEKGAKEKPLTKLQLDYIKLLDKSIDECKKAQEK